MLYFLFFNFCCHSATFSCFRLIISLLWVVAARWQVAAKASDFAMRCKSLMITMQKPYDYDAKAL